MNRRAAAAASRRKGVTVAASVARIPAPAGADRPAESRLRRHLVLVCLAGASLLVFPYFRALESPNENVRIWQTRAIAHHGTFAIGAVVREWGEVTDTAAVGPSRYSSKAPGTSLLGVPIHFVHDRLAELTLGRSPSPLATTWVLRVFTVILPMLAFFWIFARRVQVETGSPLARDLLTLGLGAGTMLYPYGLTFVGHAQSAALLFSGFLALAPPAEARPGRARLALAGALCGLSVCFEYQALFGALVLAIFALVGLGRRALWFALGALGPALLLGVYHTTLFGRPWELPYAHLDDPGYVLYHHSQGFLGLGRPRAGVLLAAFVSVDYGLFVFSPFLACGLGAALFATVGRPRAGVDRVQAAILAITVALAVFLSGMANWRGGWCAAGPRYIAAVVPFLAFAIARSWRLLWQPRPWACVALTALVLVSVGLCALSGLFPHFPVQLDNPIFDLVVPLVREGYAPHSLGTALGLRGVASLVPWALVLALGMTAVLAHAPEGARGNAAAIAVALVLIGGLARYGRNTHEDLRVRAVIEGMWEPAPARAPAAGGGDGHS